MAKIPANLKFNKDGLIPAIAQHARTGHVLMMAYMNRAALRMTLDTGFAHGEISVPEAKTYLSQRGIPVRL